MIFNEDDSLTPELLTFPSHDTNSEWDTDTNLVD
jgi:hypothetical protein